MTDRAYECLRLEIAEGVGRIVFDMPEFANALTRTGVEELLDALNACESDPEVGAVVLTGAGRTRSAPGSTSRKSRRWRAASRRSRTISATSPCGGTWCCTRSSIFRKPVMSAVDGAAAGSGLGMALCSDLTVCSERARFLCAWHTIGLANDATTSYSLAKIVGFRRAQEMMITNRTLDARPRRSTGASPTGSIRRPNSPPAWTRSRATSPPRRPTSRRWPRRASTRAGGAPIEEATEYEIRNVMVSVEHPYFHEALRRFVEDGGKSSRVQVRLP